MEQPINNNLTKKIMDNIQEGKTKPKPQAYFLAETAAYVILSFFTFLISIFLASFVAFALPLGGFSWLIFVLAVATALFVILNVFLAKKFPAFYKRPLLFGFLLFILLISAISFVILQTPFHANILKYSNNNKLPIISPLYQHSCGCQKTCSCQIK